jgi:hypothetical protein
MKSIHCCVAAAAVALCYSASLNGQTPALSAVGSAGGGTPVANTIHGWEFTPAVPLKVTHLGLWDEPPTGIQHEHPIGLFRVSDSALLTSGVIHVGMGDLLLDSFRYIDSPDVTLAAGASYVISYFTAIDNGDFVITSGNYSAHPAISYVQGRWGEGPLGIPANTTIDLRIGPNFLFEIPEPATFSGALVIFGALATRRRHRS